MSRLARIPFEQTRRIAGAITDPDSLTRWLGGIARGAVTFTEALLPATPTSLSGPIVRARRYAVARIPLADIRAAAHTHDVTVNDVYLTAVAGAFRRPAP